MLTVSGLTYSIGGRTILEDCNVNIMDGWRVGVCGVNGAGKSTLFKLIAGDIQPDSGGVAMVAGRRFGMVRQDIPQTDTSLLDVVMAADTELCDLMHASVTEQDPNKLGDIYERLIEKDAYAAPARASVLLQGLGFREEQLSEPFNAFSGGWQMRVALAAALFVEPDLLLLDEPTNHLDLEAIMWLEDYLSRYPHTLLMISHDRDILNKCVNHVLHVDRKKMTLYSGDYDTFERERAMRLGLQQKMHEKQQAQRAHMQSFIDRFKAKASKARQAQSRMKALEKMDMVDAVIADRAVRFHFPSPEKLSSPLISIQRADVGYIEGKPVLRRIHENIDNDDRIALLGANGNGKSTLMKLVAGKLPPMAGEMMRSGKLRIGYFSQHQTDELDIDETPFMAMTRLVGEQGGDTREHIIRAKLGSFGFSKDLADNKIGKLSGGEKARLLFAFMSHDAPHLLLLDEPTNHLDVDAREALVQALNAYEGAVVMVSHDPHMLERVVDRLWLVKDGTCTPFDGDLEDYRDFTIRARRDARRQERKNKDKPATIGQEKPAINVSALKKQAEKAEAAVEKLAKRKEILERDMVVAADDFERMRVLQADYEDVVKKMEHHEKLWMDALAELENAA